MATFHLLSNIVRFTLDDDINTKLTLTQIIDTYSKEYGWFLKLVVNCFGYSCIFIPGYLIYKYTTKINYLERSDRHQLIPSMVRICFMGADPDHLDDGSSKTGSISRTSVRECLMLTYCFFGLMISYLTWGLLQEKIMTTEYLNEAGHRIYFKNTQFLVFSNRVLAFVISLVYLIVKHQMSQNAPLFKYSYASFSNIMSAWFQYEALKFISFPTQVLAKSCKIIPVMLMGKIVSRTKYEFYEYVTAVLISIGMIFFLMGSTEHQKGNSVTTMTGILLLILYLLFDSFTANWQGSLFKTYNVSSMQMICGVNLFSTLFTATSLALQGGFISSVEFGSEHPRFIFDCTILSLSSAIGQLFIFQTISTFGPVVFTIIMTIRQAVAILLSCITYDHHISFLGTIGICVLFFAIFLRVYCNQRLKALRKKPADSLLLPKTRINV